MLTPQEIMQANKATGNNVSPTGTPAVVSRAEQIRTLGQQATVAKEKANSIHNPDTIGKNANPEYQTGDNIGKTFMEGGQNVINDVKNTDMSGGIGNKALNVLKTAGHVAGDVAGTAGSLIGDVIAPLIPDSAKSKIGDASKYITDKIHAIPGMTPDIAKGLSDVFNTLTLEGGAKGAPLAEKGVKAVSDVTGKVVKSGVNKIKELAGKTPLEAGQAELDTIQKMISPKATAKEAKLAQSQGRLIKGKEPTLFKSGTVDEVIPSKDVQRATGTIKREIPNAHTMDEATLQTALENKTAEIAQNLKPELQKVTIKPETIKKINSDWEKIKKDQIKNADASEEANVIKLQKQFEDKLLKSSSKNMNDLWDTAKEYDSSIPENVKKATTQSDPKLQYKKDMWLQNRAILKDAINDSKNGLGAKSSQAFSDMTDMYHAKENLISKAKIVTEVKPSKIVEFAKKHPGVTGAVIGGGAVGGLLKH